MQKFHLFVGPTGQYGFYNPVLQFFILFLVEEASWNDQLYSSFVRILVFLLHMCVRCMWRWPKTLTNSLCWINKPYAIKFWEADNHTNLKLTPVVGRSTDRVTNPLQFGYPDLKLAPPASNSRKQLVISCELYLWNCSKVLSANTPRSTIRLGNGQLSCPGMAAWRAPCPRWRNSPISTGT